MLQPAYGPMRPLISELAVSVKRPFPQLVSDCQRPPAKAASLLVSPAFFRADDNDELIQQTA
jgi:hypothetical protein